ncbi:MAG: malic enzyme-like NAD(P)-binding protein [Polyangiaceae bacterium]
MSTFRFGCVCFIEQESSPSFASAIAQAGGVIGDITTEKIGETNSVRAVTLEVVDEAHADRVVEVIKALPNVEVLDVVDRTFEWHRGGKIKVGARGEVRNIRDLRHVYTPGVARVSRAIEKDPARARELTWAGSSVAIFTNGTRVLGLGDIGPLASLPVMEGKAMLYSQLVGLSAIPIVLDAKDPDTFIDIVARASIGFGAVHLEDIRTPDCFRIERELIERLNKPVFHDDQHGTAVAALAALLNVSKRTQKPLQECVVGQIGLGAAGSAIARLIHAYGVREVIVSDPNEAACRSAAAWGARPVDLTTLLATADVVVATTGRPGLIPATSVREGQVIFALSNPDPEILPDEALAAGAAFASDGRTVNNALAYPGIMRGALNVGATRITSKMLIAASQAIAGCADEAELVPSPLDPRVHEAVIAAVSNEARAAQLASS